MTIERLIAAMGLYSYTYQHLGTGWMVRSGDRIVRCRLTDDELIAYLTEVAER